MPVERISKGFKDISASFQVNPINDDLIAIKNENAIARSVRNLVFTIPGDKPFQPLIGSRVSEMLFDPMDELSSASIQREIESTIINYEPRVKLGEVQVNPDYDGNLYNVVIQYFIVGIEAEPQQLSFALELTR